MIDQRTTLLEQLRIDRDDEPAPRRGARIAWAAGIGLLLAGGAAAAWLLLGRPSATIVRVAVAEPGAVEAAARRGSILDASGYVVARRQATVSSKITGRVVELLIEEGQHVEEGEIIARLDDTNRRAELAQALAQRDQARANLDAARVAFENAQPIFERFREQLDKRVISEQDFDTAKAEYDSARMSVEVAERALAVAEANVGVAERNTEDTIVRAPFAGIVTVKAAQEGEIVSPVSAGGGFTRTGIGTIVDMDSLEVEVDVSESFINRVRQGQDVTVRLNAYPDWAIPAHVIAIIPTADRAKATVQVRVGLDQKDPRILPEMGVRVSFLDAGDDAPSAPAVQPAVVVPPDAVTSDGDADVVFVVREDRVERRAVRLGATTSAGRIVLSGITAGMRVVIGDTSQLVDGARVRIANEE
ncbi:MAG TPA: efflux RND transporter periplasmic adaptor subunit [Gammaproteobacteria bacterium]